MYEVTLKDDKSGRVDVQLMDIRDVNNLATIIYGNQNSVEINIKPFHEEEETLNHE